MRRLAFLTKWCDSLSPQISRYSTPVNFILTPWALDRGFPVGSVWMSECGDRSSMWEMTPPPPLIRRVWYMARASLLAVMPYMRPLESYLTVVVTSWQMESIMWHVFEECLWWMPQLIRGTAAWLPHVTEQEEASGQHNASFRLHLMSSMIQWCGLSGWHVLSHCLTIYISLFPACFLGTGAHCQGPVICSRTQTRGVAWQADHRCSNASLIGCCFVSSCHMTIRKVECILHSWSYTTLLPQTLVIIEAKNSEVLIRLRRRVTLLQAYLF